MRDLVIVLPTYNEEASIQETLEEYISEFPEATFIVVDNNSSDLTSENAKKALRRHDFLLFEEEQGKGAAMRTGLSLLNANIYLVADADLTYPAADARRVVERLRSERLDMVIGDRLSSGAYAAQNKRFGHSLGNALLTSVISLFLKRRYCDVLSGLRAFGAPFLHSTTIRASGFQVETELNISAAYLNAKVVEVPIQYGERPDGSESKLNTMSDGIRILYAALIGGLQVRPMTFFSVIALMLALLSAIGGGVVLAEFLDTQEMRRTGLATLSASFGVLSALSLFAGLIMSVIGQAVRDLRISRMHELKRKWLDT